MKNVKNHIKGKNKAKFLVINVTVNSSETRKNYFDIKYRRFSLKLNS